MLTISDVEVRAVLRRRITLYRILGAIGMVAVWVPYVGAAVFDVNVMGKEAVNGFVCRLYLWVAAGGTLLCPLTCLMLVRQHSNLIRRGVLTEATVEMSALGDKHGMAQVVIYSYIVDGRVRTVRRDTSTVLADKFDETTRVPVIYDPRHPAHCVVFPEHAGTAQEIAAAAEQPGAVEAMAAAQPITVKEVAADATKGLLDVLRKPLLVGLVVGQIAAVWGIWRLLGRDIEEMRTYFMTAFLGALTLTLLEDAALDWLMAGNRPIFRKAQRFKRAVVILCALCTIGTFAYTVYDQRDREQRERREQAERDERMRQQRELEKRYRLPGR